MSLCRVWNDNSYPYEEMFKEQLIRIPPAEFVEMDYFEATEFLGKFTGVRLDPSGQPDPRYYKKLRKEVISSDGVKAEVNLFKCHSCGKSYESGDMLTLHAFDNHLNQLDSDESKLKLTEEKDKIIKKFKKA